MTTLRTNETRNPKNLKPHPLNAKIYRDGALKPDFIESIKAYGVLQPLLVTPEDQIIAGHKRLQGAKLAELTEVPVRVIRDVTHPLEIERLLIVSNAQRDKDNDTLVREAAHLAEIEGKLAAEREKAGKGADGSGGRGNKKNPVPDVGQGLDGRSPRTEDVVGDALGVSHNTAAKAIATGKALEEAEESGDEGKVERIKTGLAKSVSAGHKAATEEPNDDPEIYDALGGRVCKRLHKVFGSATEFRGIINRLGRIQTDIEELQHTPAGEALPINEIQRLIPEAQKAVKFGQPYTECPKCRRKTDEKCKACHGSGWVTEGTYTRCRTKDDEQWIANRK